jgi:hypothetical protein
VRLSHLLLLLFLLVACGDVVSPPAQPPTPTPLTFTPLGDLLGRSMPVAGAQITTVGYVVVDDAGARLLDGSYHYQLDDPRLQMLSHEETSITALLDNASAYEGRLVRVAGGLLARKDSALLVEQLGAGGLPAPDTRQVKLRGPLRDPALLGRLKRTANGAIHFGQVQVEGIWRDGQLTPLAILSIS